VSRRFLVAVVFAAIAELAVLPAANGGTGGRENLTIFRLTESYPVTVEVSGHVDFDWTWDSRRECAPGYAKTTDEELSLTLGKPRRSVVSIIDRRVTMPAAVGGQAKLEADVSGFDTTNYCPPTAPFPEPPEPTCKTLKGKLAVALSPTVGPRRRDVLIHFARRNNKHQDFSCLRDRPVPVPVRSSEGIYVDTTPQPYGEFQVPLKASWAHFFFLKPGERLKERIKIHGRCDRVTARASALPEEIKSCTLGGRIVVTIKRHR
jgi:hypothetical protein